MDAGPKSLGHRQAVSARRFRKRPVVIEALRFDGENWCEVLAWMGGCNHYFCPDTPVGPVIAIETLEGQMRADPGDWIIRGVKGELYPCKPDIFAATYEEIT